MNIINMLKHNTIFTLKVVLFIIIVLLIINLLIIILVIFAVFLIFKIIYEWILSKFKAFKSKWKGKGL